MKFPKPKRKKDRDLLDTYHDHVCAVCGRWDGVVGHHIKSKGSGGDDVAENLLALCQKHHNEIHFIGTIKFNKKYNLQGEKK